MTPILPSGDGWSAVQLWMEQTEQRLAAFDNDGSGYSKQPDFRGALVSKAATLAGVNLTNAPTFGVITSWDTVAYDTSGVWSAANPTRLTVPAGVSKVRVLASAALNNVTASDYVYCAIDRRNSAGVGQTVPGAAVQAATLASTSVRLNCVSAVQSVVPGDYFEHRIWVGADTSVDIVAPNTWFAIELLG